MGGDQGGAADSGGGSDGKPRRPQGPVLNLKAIEVAAEPASEKSSSDGAAEAASAAPSEEQAHAGASSGVVPNVELADTPQAREQAADPVHRDTAAGGADAVTRDPPVRARPWRLAGLAIGAGAGAAAGAAALLAAAWFGGFPLGGDGRAVETATRVAALEAQVRSLASRPPPAPDARVGEIATRITAAEQLLGQVKQLETRLAQAEASLANLPAGNSSAADPALARRVATMEESTKALSTALADLQGRVSEIATVAQAARDATARSSGTTSANEANLAGNIDGLAKRILALEETAKALRAAQAAPPPPALERDRAARLAAAALALRPAVESGAPFADALSAVKALGGDPARLAALEPFAASGVPGADTLRRELSQLAASARRSTDASTENAGFFERLQAGAERLIRVRRTDAPASTDAKDVLGRIEASFARGDLAATMADVAKLPEGPRAALEPWVRRAQARQAALDAAREILRASMASLAASAGEPASR
jgi:hypothetical protein